MSPELKKRAKKLVSILATSIPVTKIREEVIETNKAVAKDGKESKSEYLENRA